MKTLGEQVKEHRAGKGLTQKEVGIELGISTSYVSAIENGYEPSERIKVAINQLRLINFKLDHSGHIFLFNSSVVDEGYGVRFSDQEGESDYNISTVTRPNWLELRKERKRIKAIIDGLKGEDINHVYELFCKAGFCE